jgi:hypothetical protein
VRPSALAVLRLITSSNFVGRSTGRALEDTVDLIEKEVPTRDIARITECLAMRVRLTIRAQ